MRRAVAVLLVMCSAVVLISAGMVAPVAAAEPGPFPDVPADHPFVEDIEWLVSEGITTGYADGTFRPGDRITRQAMAAFLYRYAGSPDGNAPTCTDPPFSDVPVSHPFCGEIAWLVGEGIAEGFADGTFGPGSAITRQAMAAFLFRAVDAPDPDPCAEAPFPDVPADHTFCEEIVWLLDAGITEGYADGTFRPAAVITRQAMAAFLHRLSLWEPPPAEAVSWRFVPGAVLLEPGEVGEVRLVGTDAEGHDTAALPPAFTLDSTSESLAGLVATPEGVVTVTAGTELGVGLATATLGGLVSDPLTITVADVADGVVEVPDEEILFPPPGGKTAPGVDATAVGPFAWDEIDARRFAGNEDDPGTDPVTFLSSGTRLPYVLRGDAPPLGTVLLGTGGTGLMGQVVEPDGLPTITRSWVDDDYSLVSVEMVPFTTVFDAVKADLDTEDLDAIGVVPKASGNFCDPATDPTCDPTPEIIPGDPVVTPYTGPTADDPSGGSSGGPVAPVDGVAATAAAPVGRAEIEFEVAGMTCKASPTFSPATLKLESFQPNFTHYLVLNIDVGTEVSPYVRFEAGGRASPKATFSITLQAAGGAQVECEVGDGLKYIAPLQGPWALVAPTVKVQPTLEASLSFSGGPRLRTEFTASGHARIHAGFAFDPANRYGQNPDGPFRPISLIDGPHFELVPSSALLDIGVGDGSPWTYEITAGAYIKIEIGVQFGGQMLHDFLVATGQESDSDEFFSPFGNFKAGIRARATYESDGVVLASKATNSFVGIESDLKITIEPKIVNDVLKFITNGSVSFSLEIPIPSPLKIPLFQPVVMKDPVITVDGAPKDAGSIEVATGQTLAVRTEVDPVKTFSFTGSLADGTLWEPGTLSHVRSDVIDLQANAGTPGSTNAYLDGQVTVTDELCEQWREPKPFKMLAVTRFDAAVGSIDTPSWAGEFTVKCIDPGIHFDPSSLGASGTSALKATALPSSNRTWEITSPLPEWLTAAPMSGTFAAADDEAPITFTIEPPDIDCETGPVTLTTAVVASAGELDGKPLEALLTISQTFEPGPECDPPPKAGPGGAWGDPHMVTLDGIGYEGQVFGEYVYLEPRDGGDGLRIHARHESSAEGVLHGAKVTSVTAAAVQVAGHTFEAYLRPDPTYYVDGVAWDPAPIETVELAPGVSLAHVQGQFTLTTTSHDVSLSPQGFSIYDLSVTVPEDGALQGMLGIPDGDRVNDRTRRDGVVEPHFDDVDAIHRFTDSWWIEHAADTLLVSQPLAYRYDGPDRFPQPITDEELAPTIAEVESALNPPVCTLDGPGAANYDALVRNLALDRYVWGLPLGDLTGYSCTYLVQGSATVDLGLDADAPVAGLQIEVEAPGLDPCVTVVGANGQYSCRLRPSSGAIEAPELPLVADVTARWPGDPTVVGSTTASFGELAPFMGSVAATADLVLGPDSFVIVDVSGSIVRDGNPEPVAASLTVDVDAPPGDPIGHNVVPVLTDADGAWSWLLVAPLSILEATATLSIDDGGVPTVFTASDADLEPGLNPIELDAIYDRVRLDVSGTVTRDGVPYVGQPELLYTLRDGGGATVGGKVVQVTTGSDGTYADTFMTSPTVTSADVRLRIYEDTGPVDFTVTVDDLEPGTTPVVLDASYERVQVTVSGTVVKDGAPLPGSVFLAIHSYSGPYTTLFDTTYLSSSGYGGVADEDGSYEITALLPEGTRQIGIRLDVDGQSFPLDHIAVEPGVANEVTHDVDASQPTLQLSGSIIDNEGPHTEQFSVSIYAYKENPGGGDPIYFWPANRFATADASGHWTLDEVLPRETIQVRVVVTADGQSREITAPIVMGLNPVTFDVDLSHATVDLSGVITRNGQPLETLAYFELLPYIHNPGGTPEWFALDLISGFTPTAADGSYDFSRDLPAGANHVVITSELDGAFHQTAVDVVGGSNPITFDIADDRPVLDITGTVVDEAGPYTEDISVTVFAYREPDEPGGDPVFLFFADATTVTPDETGHYQIDDVVLPPDTTRVRLSSGVHSAVFEQWEEVTVGDNAVVFDMDASRILLDVSGTLVKNGAGLNVPVPLNIHALNEPAPGEIPTSLGSVDVMVEPVDGAYTLSGYELPAGTNLVWLSMSIGGQGNFVAVSGVGPGLTTATFDLDITTAELRLEGRMKYEDDSAHTEPVLVVVWPDDGTVSEPADHPDAVQFELYPEFDGSYVIEADMPPETTRIGVWIKPTENMASSTAFDAVPGLNWYSGFDWTFDRPLVQIDGTVTVDGVPYTDTLSIEAESWNLPWLFNQYEVEWDSGAGAYLLDARLPLGSTGALLQVSFFTDGKQCQTEYELPEITWWTTTDFHFDWEVDTSDDTTCFLLG